MSIVRLQSYDGVIFDSDIEVAKCSGTIKTMLEECGIEADNVVPLSNVSSNILGKVLQWANHHVNDKKPLDADEISDWDKEFLKVDQGTLFELILAANYLDVKGLLNVACTTVANMIKGKSPEEIRRTFNIRNDISEAEMEQIRKENEQCAEADKSEDVAGGKVEMKME